MAFDQKVNFVPKIIQRTIFVRKLTLTNFSNLKSVYGGFSVPFIYLIMNPKKSLENCLLKLSKTAPRALKMLSNLLFLTSRMKEIFKVWSFILESSFLENLRNTGLTGSCGYILMR